MKTDPMVEYMLKRASLTSAQLDTYLIDRSIFDEKVGLKVKTLMRDRGPVSKGAFLHTLKQAQENLHRSIYTLILLEYLGLLEEEATVRLLQIGSLLKNIKKDLLEEKIQEVFGAIEVIIRKISGKK
ncbi:MAG: hypothetical protein HXX80_05580 [Nitrososphaerales archaeon]|nr:hypothetical protein [Nitrososphaerales archaeon]